MRHQIGAVINVIVGFPDEPESSVAETLRVAKELRAMSSEFELAIFYFKPYPGNPIAERLKAQNYHFPASLEEWIEFDYIGKSNEWLTGKQIREIECFKFYQRFAFSRKNHILHWPLQALSRFRVQRRFYHVPFERALVQRLKPSQTLS